ncbi:hypothetical protein C8J56DRAFT_1022544 [Mycena floridula]|nr:hypothetical protein C8J56DRAFT_1022544 [Mycena floridula]
MLLNEIKFLSELKLKELFEKLKEKTENVEGESSLVFLAVVMTKRGRWMDHPMKPNSEAPGSVTFVFSSLVITGRDIKGLCVKQSLVIFWKHLEFVLTTCFMSWATVLHTRFCDLPFVYDHHKAQEIEAVMLYLLALPIMAHTTLKDNVLGSIGGDFLSNNTVNNFYASAAGPSNLSRHGRGYMPASTILFGRDLDIDFIVNQLIWQPETPESKRARFAILGTGGMGKTAVAVKVVRDARLLECYSEHYQAWFPCVQATSFPLLLDTVHSALDLPSDTKNTLNAILNELCTSSKPMILLFDNFETPWNATGARAEVAQFLRDIDAIPHIAIFVTMRATVPPCEEISWKEMRIQPLDPEASFQLYTGIDTKAQEDEKLSELLKILGHMPLAVKLMARQGRSTGCTVEQLMESYKKTGTAMLGPSKNSDAQNSVSISISLSVNSPQVNEEPDAYELLSRISMLPAGTTFQALQTLWAPHIQNLQGSLQALLDTSLLECGTRTYFVLPVICSYVLDPQHLATSVQNSMIEAACSFLKYHSSINPGHSTYKEDMEARSFEEINLQSILLGATSSEPHFIQAHLTLAWHQYRIRPRTEVIQHAVKFMSDVTALLDVAYISTYIDSDTDEIPLIEQAKLELETLQSHKHNQHRRHFLPSLSTLRNRFKKGTRQPKDTSTIDNEDLARCLIDLGIACSRCREHSKAIEHLTHARELCPKLSFDGAICAQHLANSHHCLQQHDEAEKWGLLALKECQEMGGGDVNFVVRILGMIYISKGQYDKAVKYLTEALDIGKTRDDQRYIGATLLELGRAHMKKGENNDAQTAFIEALALFGSIQGVEQKMMVCRYYLAKLEDSLRLPTEEECDALKFTWHDEDILS